MNIIKKFLNRYVYQDWNIAIADISEDLTPINIKWLKHDYHDRWFADPFIINETEDTYILLVEECLHSTMRGRIARLIVTKEDFRLLKNETILDLSTHLSFPNPIKINNVTYIYPENAMSGSTKYYRYDSILTDGSELSRLPLADPVIFNMGEHYYLLATMGDSCNGNVLQIYKSDSPFGGFEEVQDFVFADNIARRGGNVFRWHNRIISPAQICNNNYGEGLSLQEITSDNGQLTFSEIKRLKPLSKAYPEGFHTYKVYGDKVIIDGYRYGSPFLHKLYFTLRRCI